MQPSFPPDPFELFHYRGPQPEQFNQNPFDHPFQQPSTHSPNSLKIKLPPMTRSSRAHPVVEFDKSGSEYRESDGEDRMDTEEAQPDNPPSPVQYTSSSRGRRYVRKTYVESESEDVDAEGELDMEVPPQVPKIVHDDEDDEDGKIPRYPTRARTARNLKGFIASEDDGEDAALRARPRLRRHPAANRSQTRSSRNKPSSKSTRSKSARKAKKPARDGEDEDVYVHNSSSESAEHDISFDAVITSPDPEPEPEEPEEDQEQERGGYGLRARAKKNYDLVTMLDNITSAQAQPTKKSPRTKGRSGANKFKGPGWSATGAQLGQWMGLNADDSVRHSLYQDPVVSHRLWFPGLR